MAIQHICTNCLRAFNRHVRITKPVCGRCQLESWKDWSKRSGAGAAAYLVNKAIKKGELASPQDLDCVDCGLRADRYDHRDYNKPLHVEPVCASCNNRRGPAIWRNAELVEA